MMLGFGMNAGITASSEHDVTANGHTMAMRTPTTPCSPISAFPFLESFSSSTLPACWAVSEGTTGATYHWEAYANDGTHGIVGPQAGTDFVRLNVYNATTNYNTYNLITPTFSLTGAAKRLKYYYFLGNGGYQGTSGATGADPYPLSVQTSTDGGVTWLSIYNHSTSNSVFAANSALSNWQLNVINLSAYAGQSVMFRFISNSNYGNNTCNQALDEFMIEDIPSCSNPIISGASNLTNVSAVISWTPTTPGTPASYNWEVRTTGTPGSGGAVASGSVTAPTMSATATGLMSSTTYSAYVQTNCGASGNSTWTGPYVFTTLCNPYTIPYIVPLASSTTTVPGLPTCLTEQTIAGSNWQTVNNPGNGFTANALEYNYGNVQADSWVYTAGLSLTGGTSYRLTYRYGNTFSTESMNVSYGTSNAASAMTNTLANYPSITGGVPSMASIDFTPGSTGTYYIGFHATSPSFQSSILLDSIHVNLTPACSNPVMSGVSNISNTVATLSWTPTTPGTPASYNWEVRTTGAPGSGGAVASGSVSAPTNSATATGLTAYTTYSAYVQTNCGAGGNSTWSLAYTFTTQCNPYSIPYTVPLASTTTPALPMCTTTQTLAGNAWQTVNNPGSGFTHNTLEYTNANVQADSWFYTAGLNLTGGTSYRLTYRYGNNSTSYTESMDVDYGTSAMAGAMTNTLASYPTINTATPSMAAIDFVPGSTGVYYIGFHASSIANQYNLYLDSIHVDLTPACSNPTGLMGSGITSSAVTLSWTPTTPGTPASYNWEVRTTGAPGSGGAAASGSVTAPTMSATATGLSPTTTYSAYVQTNCSASGNSTWSGPYVFTTACVAITSLPWTEGFESVSPVGAGLFPPCWTYTNMTGSNPGTKSITDTYDAPRTGSNYMYSKWSSTSWVYTPGFQLTAGTSYDFSFYMMNKDGTAGFTMDVAYGSSATIAGMTSTLQTGYAANNTTYSQFKYTFVPSSTGTYYFGVKSTCTSSAPWYLNFDDFALNVTPPCTVTAVPSSTAICAGSSATLTASGATNYTWTPGALTGTAVVVSPTVATVYTVTGVGTSCTSSTGTVSVVVGTSSPTVMASASSSTICAGSTVSLTASGANNYTWSPGAQTSSSITVTPTISTTYTVVGNTTGCTNTKTLSITVTPLQTVTASASSSVVCSGSSVTLTAMGASTYSWSSGASTASTVITPTITMGYTVTGTNSCGTSSAVTTVSVNPKPPVSATSSSSVICVGQTATLTASGAGSYTWTPGPLTGTTVVVSPTVTTNYTVSGTSGMGCVSAPFIVTQNVSPCTGIEEFSSSDISLYPNPTTGYINVSVPAFLVGKAVIEVYDAVGKLVVKDNLTDAVTHINTSKLEEGLYIYRIYNSDGLAVKIGRMVKNK